MKTLMLIWLNYKQQREAGLFNDLINKSLKSLILLQIVQSFCLTDGLIAMDIYQFIELSTEEQVNTIWQGTFIANRNYKGFNVVLYSIDNFFVEVFYNQTENAINQIRPFRSRTRLMPYINSIDLTELIC